MASVAPRHTKVEGETLRPPRTTRTIEFRTWDETSTEIRIQLCCVSLTGPRPRLDPPRHPKKPDIVLTRQPRLHVCTAGRETLNQVVAGLGGRAGTSIIFCVNFNYSTIIYLFIQSIMIILRNLLREGFYGGTARSEECHEWSNDAGEPDTS